MSKLRIFVSSVQKELENERQAVLSLVSTDPFLQQHCEVVLYELEPAFPEKSLEGCLNTLDTCAVYLTIIWKEYGHIVDALSITHHEYQHAKKRKLPIFIYVKGPSELKREDGVNELLKEIRKDDLKYKRFNIFIDLQHEIRSSLLKFLKSERGVSPSSDENETAEQTIDATSDFEIQKVQRMTWDYLNIDLARKFVAIAEMKSETKINKKEILQNLLLRGLFWKDAASEEYYATAAGTLLFAKDPSVVFPQCRIMVDAYSGTEVDNKPLDHDDIRASLPVAIEQAIAFINKNTRHPIRIVGLNRITLDEYPVEALREALVNAIAHRDYNDGSRKIIVEKFADRIVISSPGRLPHPLTIKKLQTGKYKPCSRNPIIAQCLSYFHRIEERGSGFRRMKAQMLDHGLDQPLLGTDSGYFQVIFQGPGDDLDKLRLPAGIIGQEIVPSLEQQLSDRQKKIMAEALKTGSVTTKWCIQELKVVRDTAYRDLQGLVKLNLLVPKGSGRSAMYILKRVKSNE